MEWLQPSYLRLFAAMLVLGAVVGIVRFVQRYVAQQVRAEKARAPRRKEIQTMLDSGASGPSDIRLPEGSPLEERVAALFRRLGAEVEIAPEDGEPGVDMVVTHLGQRLGLQMNSSSFPALTRRTSGHELLDRDDLMDAEVSSGTVSLFAYSGREVDGQTVIDSKALRAWEEQGTLPKPLSRLFSPLDVLDRTGFERGPNEGQRRAGFDFEDRIKSLFERHGAAVEMTPREGDYGVDLVVSAGGQRYAVQCKCYSRKNPVRQEAVREAVAGMPVYRCTQAIVVTTSWFTNPTRDLASANDCIMIDGKALRRWEQSGTPPESLRGVLKSRRPERSSASRQAATSSSTRVLLARAVTQERAGQHAASIVLCDQAIKGGELNAYAYNTRAIARERSGDLSGACNDYGRAIGCDPQHAVLYYNRGKALLALDCPEEALSDLRRGVELEPENAKLASSLGSALARLGRYREAIAAYDRALALDPTRVEVLSKRDWAQAMLEEGEV